jgi:hypothetical protein
MSQSQQYRTHAWAVMVFTVIASACSSGCSSAKGPDRTARVVESFRATRGQLAEASKQVGTTSDSLRTLTSAGAGDLRPMFDDYVENVRKTQAMADKARNRAEAMRANAESYTAQWQKELSKISDEELRLASEQRAAAAKADFDRVRIAAGDVKGAYAPYRQGLQDVQQYLTNDLTADGARSIKTKADDTITKGEALQQRIASLEKELDALSSKWSSNLGPPPA